MSSKELNSLVKTGTIKEEPADQVEFDRLVGSGRTRLSDSHKNNLSAESRFELAYSAAHSLSLAAMRWHGFRPNNQRYVVFMALAYTLGLDAKVWRLLDKCHRVRNAFEYEGYFGADQQMLTELISVTETVLKAVEKLGAIDNVKK